jgi:tRNA modification GTPase
VPRLAAPVVARQLYLCRVVDPATGELLDRALVCRMPGPRSYTGEDLVELQVHGGPAGVAAITAACVAAGARWARPGEFTLRAFLNGKLDLAAAEAVAALVQADGDHARRVALQQLEGGLGAAVRSLRDDVVALLAELEAVIDFPEEVPAPLDQRRWSDQAVSLEERLESLLAQYPSGHFARSGARVVLLGQPNVGKSSLFNALLGHERAIVHAEPGTTRDFLEGGITLGGVRVTLVDTAGQRVGSVAEEQLGMSLAWDEVRRADAVLLVLNACWGFTPVEASLWSRLEEVARLVVLNQIDCVAPAELETVALQVPPALVVRTSATERQGLKELTDATTALLRLDQPEIADLPLVTEERHRDLLTRALANLRRVIMAIPAGSPEDLVSLELREAAGALGEIVGEGVTEAVLEAIFSRFCIGK